MRPSGAAARPAGRAALVIFTDENCGSCSRGGYDVSGRMRSDPFGMGVFAADEVAADASTAVSDVVCVTGSSDPEQPTTRSTDHTST